MHKDEVVKLLDQLERTTGKICQAKIIIGRKTHRIGYLKDRVLQVRDTTPSFSSLNGTWKNLNEIHQAIQMQKMHELVKVGWVPIDVKDQRVIVNIDKVWKFMECPMCHKFELNSVKSELPKHFECKYCKHNQCGPYYDVWASLDVDLQKSPYKIVRKIAKNFHEEAEDHGKAQNALAYPTVYTDKSKSSKEVKEEKIPIAYIDIMPINEMVSGFREPLRTPREQQAFDLPPEIDTRTAESPRFLMPVRKPFDPTKVGGIYMLPTAKEVTYKTPVAAPDTVLYVPPRPKYNPPSMRKVDIEKLLHKAYTTSGDPAPSPPSNPASPGLSNETDSKFVKINPNNNKPKPIIKIEPKIEPTKSAMKNGSTNTVRKVGFVSGNKGGRAVGDKVTLKAVEAIDRVNIEDLVENKNGKSTVKQRIKEWDAVANKIEQPDGKNSVFRKKEEKKPGILGMFQ